MVSILGTYDEIRDFHGGFACVQKNEKWGVVDAKGQEIVTPQFYYISDFVNGIAKYIDDEKNTKRYNHNAYWGYIDSKGVCSECKYYEPDLLSTGIALLTDKNHDNYKIDNKGRIILQNEDTFIEMPTKYQCAKDFSQGFAPVKDYNGFWGAINIKGIETIACRYKSIKTFSENKVFATNQDDKLCLLSTSGHIITTFDFTYYSVLSPYQNGYATIRSGNTSYIVDSLGKTILSIEAYAITPTSIHGEYILIKDNKHYKKGIYNITTKTLVLPRYKNITRGVDCYIGQIKSFTECTIDFNGKVFAYNGLNKVYLPEWCAGGKNFQDGFCSAISYDGIWGIVDLEGNTIIHPWNNGVDIINNMGDSNILEMKIINVTRTRYSNETKTSFKCGLFNTKTRVHIPAKFDQTPKRLGECYLTSSNGKLGLCDDKGKEILTNKYDSISYKSGYYILGQKQGRIFYGLFHQNNGILYEPQFEKIGNCDDNGLILVQSGDKVVHINPTGRRVIYTDTKNYSTLPSQFLWSESFKNDIAKVWINDCVNYIDRDFCLVKVVNDKVVKLNNIDWIVATNQDGISIYSLNGKMGLLSSDGISITEAKYHTIEILSNNLYICTTKDESEIRKGIIDSYGNTILPFIYSMIQPYTGRVPGVKTDIYEFNNTPIYKNPTQDYWLISKNGKYGLINKEGNICIHPVYTDIKEFESFFYVKSCGWSILKKQSLHTIDFSPSVTYLKIELLKDGIYKILKNGGKWGVIDKNCNEILPPIYESVEDIDGVLLVRVSGSYYNGNGYGLITYDNEQLIPCSYSSITPAALGRFWIYKDRNEVVGLASTDGKILIEPKYGKVEPYVNGYAKVNDGHWFDEKEERTYSIHTYREFALGKWGIIDINGNVVVPTMYESIKLSEDGNYFKVTKKIANTSKIVSGRLNLEGNLIIKDINNNDVLSSSKYDWQEDYDEGYSIVYSQGKVGKVNQDMHLIINTLLNSVVLPPEFDWGYDTNRDVVIVEKNGKRGLINSDAEILIEPQYDKIEFVEDSDICIVTLDEKQGLVNWDSEALIELKYDVIQVLTHYGKHLCICGIKRTKSWPLEYNWHLYKDNGECISQNYYKEFHEIGYGLISVKTTNDLFLLYNHEGSLLFDIPFSYIGNFSYVKEEKGLNYWERSKKIEMKIPYAVVSRDGKFGVISFLGFFVIPCVYDSIQITSQNTFILNGQLVDLSLKKIVSDGDSICFIEKEYDKTEILENGLILVQKDYLYGVINQIGHIIIPLIYSHLVYKSNLFIAYTNDATSDVRKVGVISISNDIIIPFSESINEIKIENGLILYKQKNGWGAYSKTGNIICEPIYDHIIAISDDLIKVGKNGEEYHSYESGEYDSDGEWHTYTDYSSSSIIEWGLINYKGKEVLPLIYRSISEEVVDGKIEIRSAKYVGYTDIAGNILIEPRYEKVGNFNNGYAIVSKSSYYYYEDYMRRRYKNAYERFGVIDSSFIEVFPCVFHEIKYDANLGMFVTEKGYKTKGGKFLIDINGKKIYINSKYTYCKDFNNNAAVAIVETENNIKCGLIDVEGKDILPPIFQEMTVVDDNSYKFKLNGKFGLVDSHGIILAGNKYIEIGEFISGIARVIVIAGHENTKNYGLIDKTGKEILPPFNQYISEPYGVFISIKVDGKWGILDLKTRSVNYIPNASSIEQSSNDLWKFNVGGVWRKVTIYYDENGNRKEEMRTEGGNWGFVDNSGKIIIPAIYEQVFCVSEDIAAVKYKGKYGFININGKIVVPFEYDNWKSNYEDGVGKLTKDGIVYVFNKLGEIIHSYNDDSYDNDYYDDDSSSVYDNPYYNDNLDMDQQSIEFWNSL